VLGKKYWREITENADVQIWSSHLTIGGIWDVPETGLLAWVSMLEEDTYLEIVFTGTNANAPDTFILSANHTTLSGRSPFQGTFVGGAVQ